MNSRTDQRITIILPRALLKRLDRRAARRKVSISSLAAEALSRLLDADLPYSAARQRSLAAIRSARSLGTTGKRT